MKAKKVTRRRRLRAVTRPPMSKAWREKMEQRAEWILNQCDVMWDSIKDLDTAVRDTGAEGIPYLLWCAYDCEALAMTLAPEEFQIHAEKKIFDWFNERGFAVWFSLGAGSLFRKTRPWICYPALVELSRPRRRSSGGHRRGPAKSKPSGKIPGKA